MNEGGVRVDRTTEFASKADGGGEVFLDTDYRIDQDCDDGLYCDGAETCVNSSCQPGIPPCPVLCDEGTDQCVNCLVNEECDDGLFCNGVETCTRGVCQPGPTLCPSKLCDEDTDQCVDCLVDAQCDDGLFCSGVETCAGGVCQPGSAPCPVSLCDEVGDICTSGDLQERPPQPSPVTNGVEGRGSGDGRSTGTDVQDPVYLYSGEFYETDVDLRIAGRGLDWVWARKYRSRIGPHTAQGHGWDFSYNIRIEPAAPFIVLHDGNSRRDFYVDQGNGTWAALGFFRVLSENPDTSYTLTFANRSTWVFNPFDGTPQQGKILAMADLQGNTMTFDYDGLGRLVTIHDSLDTPVHNRDITIAYNAAGFIESVTDFTGRQVRYTYYDGIEPGGSAGDLKTATSPVVAGTPNGNDFPNGKTTTYTYTTGFADSRLNHNMLSITDGRGRTYLQNVYAPTQNPGDFDFDRVVQQTWGDPGDRIDTVYVPQTPALANNMAVVKAIVNDRVGNVKEYFFDAANHAVMLLEYTGRADPDSPTTEADNRPTAQLRPTDPPLFETRYGWDANSLPTHTVWPNLNEETFLYDPAKSDPRSRGNLLAHCAYPGPLGGDQPKPICESFEYDPVINSDTNYLTRALDGRGYEINHEYDAAGNRTRTIDRIASVVEEFEYNAFGQQTARVWPDNGSGHRRRDEFVYYTAGLRRGYLFQEIIDAANFAITTTYEYDAVGNVTRVIDPRGHDQLFVYNALDQVVRRTSREVTDGSGVRYDYDIYYDANNNVVRFDVPNVDENGVIQSNARLTTIFEYETLNRTTRVCSESGDVDLPGAVLDCAGINPGDLDQFVVSENQYDANRNQTLDRSGEATTGNQPANVVRDVYDERDLLFRNIRAEGDPLQSSTQYDYDGNENCVREMRGLEDAPRIFVTTYDGYDRPTTSADPMGNVTSRHYDANNNLIAQRIDGELIDAAGAAANVRLSEVAYAFDEMNRLTRMEVEFFDAGSQAPIPGGQQLGQSIVQAQYSDNSQVIRVIDDNLHDQQTAYDTANRESVWTDAKLNTTTFLYDANSNVISNIEVEKSDLGGPDETYMTTFAYDNLDRLTLQSDTIGNKLHHSYDSRDNRTVFIDARANETRMRYDGLNQLTQQVVDMSGNGASPADPADIVTGRAYDHALRLVQQTDDNGNVLTMAHDPLNRVTTATYADGTAHTTVHDVHDNEIVQTDANGSIVLLAYDLLNRVTGKTILPGPTVSPEVTFEVFKYDGLSRLIYAEDDDSLVTYDYDSLSHATSEAVNGQATAGVFDGIGNRTGWTYPGGRVVTATHDELNRKKTISDAAGILATFDYIGPQRMKRRDYRNGTRCEYEYDGIPPNAPGDFGRRKVIRTTHSMIAGGPIVDDRTYTWDRMMNKTQRKDIRIGGPQLTHDYSYDPAHRLIQTTVTDGAQQTVRNTMYDLDGAGSRQQISGGPCPGTYTCDPALAVPADCQTNQYSTTASDCRQYDDNGNLVRTIPSRLYGDVFPAIGGDGAVDLLDIICLLDDFADGAAPSTCPGSDLAPCGGDGVIDLFDIFAVLDAFSGQPGCPAACPQATAGCAAKNWTIMYNYRNQPVELVDHELDQRHVYTYDALGRRITRILDADGTPSETRYFRDGTHVIEEQDGNGATLASYVFGQFVDEALNMLRGGNHYYYHADEQLNVVALTDAAGVVVERYDHQDYGAPEFRDTSGNTVLPVNESPIGNPFIFNTRRYDPETGWLCYRTRFLDPAAGRFVTRDTIGMWGDRTNLGNAYTYAGNNPATYVDPFGLQQAEPRSAGESLIDEIGNKLKAIEATKKAIDDNRTARREALKEAPAVAPNAEKAKAFKKRMKDEFDDPYKELQDKLKELREQHTTLLDGLAKSLRELPDSESESRDDAKALYKMLLEELNRFDSEKGKETKESQGAIDAYKKMSRFDRSNIQKVIEKLGRALKHLTVGEHQLAKKLKRGNGPVAPGGTVRPNPTSPSRRK